MDQNDKKMSLFSLQYSRSFSRAHTIFSCWIELMLAVTIGFFGIILSYSEVFGIKPDIYKFIALAEFSAILAGIISVIAGVFVYKTRVERNNLTKRINNLKISQMN